MLVRRLRCVACEDNIHRTVKARTTACVRRLAISNVRLRHKFPKLHMFCSLIFDAFFSHPCSPFLSVHSQCCSRANEQGLDSPDRPLADRCGFELTSFAEWPLPASLRANVEALALRVLKSLLVLSFLSEFSSVFAVGDSFNLKL